MFRCKLLLIGLAGLVVFLAGSVAVAQTYSSALDKIKETGVLCVGFAQTEPGSYIDVSTGQWAGIMVDLFKDLADRMNVKLQIIETTWPLFMLDLNEGKFDVFGSHTFYLPTRALQVDFTVPLFYKGVGLVCRADDHRFQTLDDVRKTPRVRIGVRVGAVEETIIPKEFPNAEVVAYKTETAPEIAEAVRVGIIDIWAADEIMQRLYIAKNPWARQIGVVGSHPMGICVRQGDAKWLNFLNSYIYYIRSSGDLARYFKKYGQSLSTLYPPEYKD